MAELDQHTCGWEGGREGGGVRRREGRKEEGIGGGRKGEGRETGRDGGGREGGREGGGGEGGMERGGGGGGGGGVWRQLCYMYLHVDAIHVPESPLMIGWLSKCSMRVSASGNFPRPKQKWRPSQMTR